MEPVIQYALLFGMLGAVWSYAWGDRLMLTAHVILHVLQLEEGEPVTWGDVTPLAAEGWLGAAAIQLLVTLLAVGLLVGWGWVLVLVVAFWFMVALAITQLPAAGGRYFRRLVVKDLVRRRSAAQRQGCRGETEQLSALISRVRAIEESGI